MIASLVVSILLPPFYSDESIRPPVSLHEEQGLPTASSKECEVLKWPSKKRDHQYLWSLCRVADAAFKFSEEHSPEDLRICAYVSFPHMGVMHNTY